MPLFINYKGKQIYRANPKKVCTEMENTLVGQVYA